MMIQITGGSKCIEISYNGLIQRGAIISKTYLEQIKSSSIIKITTFHVIGLAIQELIPLTLMNYLR